jgi:hypothetical protein
MNNGLVHYSGPLIAQDKRGQVSQPNQRPTVPYLELDIERALQGARRCRRCAAVHGRYVCLPSAAVRNEWRHSDAGVELILHLITCHPDGGPRLQAMIVVENGGQFHARAVYSCDLAGATFHEGPWTLRLISEKSECDFVFPGQVEVVASGKLSTPRQ